MRCFVFIAVSILLLNSFLVAVAGLVRADVIRGSSQTCPPAWHLRAWTEIVAGNGRCRSRTSCHRAQRAARWPRPRSFRRWGLWSRMYPVAQSGGTEQSGQVEHRVRGVPLLGEDHAATTRPEIGTEDLAQEIRGKRRRILEPLPLLAVVDPARVVATDPLRPAVEVEAPPAPRGRADPGLRRTRGGSRALGQRALEPIPRHAWRCRRRVSRRPVPRRGRYETA
jgi:hypothetical protein